MSLIAAKTFARRVLPHATKINTTKFALAQTCANFATFPAVSPYDDGHDAGS